MGRVENLNAAAPGAAKTNNKHVGNRVMCVGAYIPPCYDPKRNQKEEAPKKRGIRDWEK